MINALDRETFGSGTKVLAPGLFILGSGISLDYSEVVEVLESPTTSQIKDTCNFKRIPTFIYLIMFQYRIVPKNRTVRSQN